MGLECGYWLFTEAASTDSPGYRFWSWNASNAWNTVFGPFGSFPDNKDPQVDIH